MAGAAAAIAALLLVAPSSEAQVRVASSLQYFLSPERWKEGLLRAVFPLG